eukprot:3239897-Karenia_brevis.AAC.1
MESWGLPLSWCLRSHRCCCYALLVPRDMGSLAFVCCLCFAHGVTSPGPYRLLQMVSLQCQTHTSKLFQWFRQCQSAFIVYECFAIISNDICGRLARRW